MLFIDETPHRYHPIESHTTSLPLINYLPSRLAYAAAKRFSRRYIAGDSWEDLLRKGIRGATAREVLHILRRLPEGRPVLLQPHRMGLRNCVDLWYQVRVDSGMPHGLGALRLQAKRLALMAVWRAFQLNAVPQLSLAIRKRAV